MRTLTLVLFGAALGCTPAAAPVDSPTAAPAPAEHTMTIETAEPAPKPNVSVKVGPNGAALETTGKDGGVSIDVKTDAKK